MIISYSKQAQKSIPMKFIPSDSPLPDEIEAIKKGEEDYKNGDILTHEEVWK